MDYLLLLTSNNPNTECRTDAPEQESLGLGNLQLIP